jgi:hypothetical protein
MGEKLMKLRSKINAGGIHVNHNPTLAPRLKVKTKIKAGGIQQNHNERPAKAVHGKVTAESKDSQRDQFRLCLPIF